MGSRSILKIINVHINLSWKETYKYPRKDTGQPRPKPPEIQRYERDSKTGKPLRFHNNAGSVLLSGSEWPRLANAVLLSVNVQIIISLHSTQIFRGSHRSHIDRVLFFINSSHYLYFSHCCAMYVDAKKWHIQSLFSCLCIVLKRKLHLCHLFFRHHSCFVFCFVIVNV